ncbi:hypothetical protein GGI07_000265 [Coemansia sp. Benny D115]|nr:hypothetical protein GGI07_000265 [Coemansia sp. Benny D115]
MAGARRQNSQSATAAPGKISIANLVSEGLLTQGNVVVCNNWPFSAVVTASGTFDARWQPLPEDFVAGQGTEFMRAEFETPSAWATAVCRVMRAQARAQHSPRAVDDTADPRPKTARPKQLASTGGSGESRVAVNGWTACRVRFSRDDRNRQLALRLDLEARGVEERAFEAGGHQRLDLEDTTPGDIEISLDALRRELSTRIARARHRDARAHPSEDAHDRPMLVDADDRDASGSDSDRAQRMPPPPAETAGESIMQGALDGLAKRVESGLALGCVKQRKAAAAAADAISAAAHALTLSLSAAGARKSHIHSRKRKSIPDMSRHAKLSRVPTENSNDSEPDDAPGLAADGDMADGSGRLVSEQARAKLEYFQACALALKRPQQELKALRYQRRQQLRRSIASALDSWMLNRRQQRLLDDVHGTPPSPFTLAATRPPSAQSLLGSPVTATAMPLPLSDAAVLNRMAPPPYAVRAALRTDLVSRVPHVLVPESVLSSRAAFSLHAACVQCASTGDTLLRCGGCGDRYHSFCAPWTPASRPGCNCFLCPACRMCATCQDSQSTDDLLHCDQCGLSTHVQCSSQRSDHIDGLLGQVLENGGHWLCDHCICCLECGFRMSAMDSDSDDLQRCKWAYDFALCGTCALQIEKAKVCLECIATYSNSRMGTNMVCCDICAFWIHTECDPNLTPDVYDALITLDDDAPYVCPRCASMIGSKSAHSYLSDSGTALALPRCLAVESTMSVEGDAARDSDAPMADEDVKLMIKSEHELEPEPELELEPEPETEAEAANLLLSFTHADVRFGRDRFDVEALEARFCSMSVSSAGQDTRDWRSCALCGLHGDGAIDQKPGLGRLVPLASASAPSDREQAETCGHWVHVECLAWAWGPRPVGIRDSKSSLILVRFEGVLLDGENLLDLSCTLCGRSGASLHCCAPVPCAETAYHLPCLLLASSPSPSSTLHDTPQYCAGWRRALCSTHAPMFSAMMPADGSVESASYDGVRIEGCITNTLPKTTICDSATLLRIGNTVYLDPNATPHLRCLRYFEWSFRGSNTGPYDLQSYATPS